jgi:hypothetical protein
VAWGNATSISTEETNGACSRCELDGDVGERRHGPIKGDELAFDAPLKGVREVTADVAQAGASRLVLRIFKSQLGDATTGKRNKSKTNPT